MTIGKISLFHNISVDCIVNITHENNIALWRLYHILFVGTNETGRPRYLQTIISTYANLVFGNKYVYKTGGIVRELFFNRTHFKSSNYDK